MMGAIGKARISDKTFDEFLANENLLAVCEADAIAEMNADQSEAAMKSLDRMLDIASGSVGLGDLGRR
jgi:hypothetical protein